VRASWPDELVVRTTVLDLPGDLAATKARTTVLVLVGDALAESTAAPARSHLYSPEYSHKFRKARPA
jgi:precorrin-4/cobalt-precorrin-4 C11-methyltransferase